MTVNDIIVYVMIGFALLGAIDRIFGDRTGLGPKFEEGIMTLGTLMVSASGIMILAPFLGDVCRPVLLPLFNLIGADPGMFPGMILGVDMGAAPLGYELAETEEGGALGGIVTASMMGATISFTIPVALGAIQKEDQKYLALGMLMGIITIPVGVFVGGLVIGAGIGFILINIIPVAIIAALVCVGLIKFEGITVKIFIILGKVILGISLCGLCIGILDAFVGIKLIDNITPFDEVAVTFSHMVVVLAGAFGLMFVVEKICAKPLAKAGKRMNINETSIMGLLITLASSIPVYNMIKDMDVRGKILNSAFVVSASWVFGDHLGFVAGFKPDMILALILGKLSAAVTALILAFLAVQRREDCKTELILEGDTENEYIAGK